MANLNDALLALAKLVENVHESAATGGNTTTLVDNTLSFGAGYFTNGILWVISGNNVGRYAKITGWDNTTKTFTFAAMPLTMVAGDLYAAAPGDYPFTVLVQSINKALVSLGDLLKVNTTLVGVSDQQDYTLPAGVRQIVRVETSQEAAAPFDWGDHRNYREVYDGTTYVLRFDDGHLLEGGDKIRIWYRDAHPILDSYDDLINGYVHIERLAWEAATHALRWRLTQLSGDDPFLNGMMNEALAKARTMAQLHPLPMMERAPRLAGW
jgi:hypothetical protein